MKRLPVGRQSTIVDDNFELPPGAWLHFNAKGYVEVLAKKGGADKYVTVLHRLVVGALVGQVVDHINRDRADNRRENLRVCSIAENGWNTHGRLSRKASQYKCVYPDKKKWRAEVTANGIRHRAPACASEAEAALAANDLMTRLHGPFACLNEVV